MDVVYDVRRERRAAPTRRASVVTARPRRRDRARPDAVAARVARVAARARRRREAPPRRANRDRGGVRARWRARRSGSRGVARDAVWEPRARERRDDRDATNARRRRAERDVETFAHEGATTANLGAWLARRGVAVDKFDRARGTKNLEDLLIELKSGESVLVSERERASGETNEGETDEDATETCVRYVDVLTLRVRRPGSNAEDGMCLIEKEQIFGRNELKRRRNRPLSEKMNFGEHWRDCVERAVREELGSALGDGYFVETLDDTYKLCVSEETSVSYPGLRSRFALHRVDAIVHGLPDEDEFQSEETTHRGVLRATWRFEEFRWPETDPGPA